MIYLIIGLILYIIHGIFWVNLYSKELIQDRGLISLKNIFELIAVFILNPLFLVVGATYDELFKNIDTDKIIIYKKKTKEEIFNKEIAEIINGD